MVFVSSVVLLLLTKINLQQQATWFIPLSLSFYVFRNWSVYWDFSSDGDLNDVSLLDFFLFSFYLPSFLTGPFLKISGLMNATKEEYSFQKTSDGLFLFIRGCAKKVLISQVLIIPLMDRGSFSSAETVLRLFLNVIYVTADLSSYTDMVRGISKICGIDLPINFNLSLLATNISDFWQRQHITFSNWLREYIYYPLFFKSSSQYGASAGYVVAVCLTFLFSGFWHVPSQSGLIFATGHIFAFLSLSKSDTRLGKIKDFIIMWIVLLITFWPIVQPEDSWTKLNLDWKKTIIYSAWIGAVFSCSLFALLEYYDYQLKKQNSLNLKLWSLVMHVMLFALTLIYFNKNAPTFLYFSF